MIHDNLMLDVIEAVAHMEVSDENLAIVLTAQAKYMSGLPVDDCWYLDEDTPPH